MTTKLRRMVALLDKLLHIKLHHPLITWSCYITWQVKTITFPLPQCLWPWNLVGWLHILKSSQPISHTTPRSRDLTKSRDKNHHFSTTRVPMATKLDRIVAHLNGLLPIKFHNPLIKWSCKTMWQAKTIIFPLS